MRSISLPKLKLNKKLLLFLSIMGPGLITACADNDAGGIATYSMAGSHYGYSLLWMLLLITFCLAIIQEMCARMGAVTGKGLSDLIREEFGLKWTMFAMGALFFANIATSISNLAGVAASMEIFGIVKYISVPVIAFTIWFVVVKGSFKIIERVFLVFCLVQFSYILSGFLARPDWGGALQGALVPSFKMDSSYILIVIGTIGTTITPWMQFFIQSSVVDKGITIKHFKYERLEVFFGALVTDIVAFFIIVACASTLFKYGISIETAKDAAMALEPIAGKHAELLFALGLFGASTLAASILPLSSAYALSEAFGFENGLDKKWKEAPVFYGLFTFFIVVASVVVLVPKISLLGIMLLSQQINGILLPVILVFMMLIINNKRIMGKYVNSRMFNIAAWSTVAVLILLTLLLFFSAFIG